MVFCRKPISKSQRQERQLVRPVIEKSRICICGNFQEAFYQDTSTTNADAHLVRLIAVNAKKHGNNVLASTDVRSAFLNAAIDPNAPVVLVRPPSKVMKMGLIPPSTLWRCTKAVYGLRESPKMWEVHRDKVLSDFEWTHNGKKHFLQQSHLHPSTRYVLESKSKPPKIKPQCLDDGDVPRSYDDLKGKNVATFIVYVDDLLAVGSKKTLEGFADSVGHCHTRIPYRKSR
eukprot:4445501-Amphidinium_carterae.1